jgi:hypothetical protein
MCEHPNVIKFLTIPHKDHGSIHIVVEWGNFLKNVGLQHEVFPIINNHTLLWQGGIGYGKVNMTCHL